MFKYVIILAVAVVTSIEASNCQTVLNLKKGLSVELPKGYIKMPESPIAAFDSFYRDSLKNILVGVKELTDYDLEKIQEKFGIVDSVFTKISKSYLLNLSNQHQEDSSLSKHQIINTINIDEALFFYADVKEQVIKYRRYGYVACLGKRDSFLVFISLFGNERDALRKELMLMVEKQHILVD
ncbi:MAG: hypothetical protein ACTHYC_10035 [Sphingobacterium sp.]